MLGQDRRLRESSPTMERGLSRRSLSHCSLFLHLLGRSIATTGPALGGVNTSGSVQSVSAAGRRLQTLPNAVQCRC